MSQDELSKVKDKCRMENIPGINYAGIRGGVVLIG